MSSLLDLNLCRLCQENSVKLNKSKTNVEFNKIVLDLLQINLEDDSDSLPKTICLDCEKLLINFDKFKRKIQNVNKCLQDLIRNNKGLFETKKNHSCKNKSAKKLKEAKIEEYLVKEEDEVKESIENIYIEVETQQESKIQCEDNFENHDLLEEDLTSHKTPLSYKCRAENCTKEFSTYYIYQKHMREHDGKLFLCAVCGKSFKLKCALKSHEKTHDEFKEHVCEFCNLRFSVRCNLRTHIRLHHENVRFYCSQCPKNYKRRDDLYRHEKVHDGIKDFHCDLCPSVFFTSKELNMHRKFHSDDKPFQCEHCFKKFFTKYHLKEHNMIHTGERPFKCPIPGCEKSYISNRKLKRHLSSGHI